MLGAKSTCHGRGACGANGAAPSAATRNEVTKPRLDRRRGALVSFDTALLQQRPTAPPPYYGATIVTSSGLQRSMCEPDIKQAPWDVRSSELITILVA